MGNTKNNKNSKKNSAKFRKNPCEILHFFMKPLCYTINRKEQHEKLCSLTNNKSVYIHGEGSTK